MYTLMNAVLLRSGEDFEGRHFFAFPGQNSCGVWGKWGGGSHVIILIEPKAIRMTNGTLLEQACNLTAGTEGRG